MTSYNKMSKKQQKAYNASKRGTWAMSPVTRVPESPRKYNRAKEKARMYD